MPDEQETLWSQMHIAHLQMIQDVISRMADNSASSKRYCITIAAAIIGFSAAIESSDLLYYSSPLIVIFAILDGHYLRLERAFRDQFNTVRKAGYIERPDFSISPSWKAAHGISSGFWSWSVWLFYIPIIIVFFLIAQFAN